MTKEEIDDKEEFCGVCLTAPLAMVASGGGIAGSSALIDRKKHKTLKSVIFVIGISIAVLSILYSIYVLYKQKSTGLAVCNK